MLTKDGRIFVVRGRDVCARSSAASSPARSRPSPAGAALAGRGVRGFPRLCQGLLKGIDNNYSMILQDSYERVFSATAGVEQVTLGLYILRGDNVATIGEIDADVDGRLDWALLKADPLGHIVY